MVFNYSLKRQHVPLHTKRRIAHNEDKVLYKSCKNVLLTLLEFQTDMTDDVISDSLSWRAFA